MTKGKTRTRWLRALRSWKGCEVAAYAVANKGDRSGISEGRGRKTTNPGCLDRGFVADGEWGPVLEQVRTFCWNPDPDEVLQMDLRMHHFPNGMPRPRKVWEAPVRT
jgi:hypothetical protein